MSETPKIPDEEITAKLRSAARRRRPWTVGSALLTILVLGVPPALLAWWFWPRAHPPAMIVIGFDHVMQTGKSAMLRAATEPAEPSDNRWGGLDLFFEEISAAGAGTGETMKVRTDENGMAAFKWQPKAAATITEIEVRYLDERIKPVRFDVARCRIFSWPTQSRVLVVDVQPTLKQATDWPQVAKALADAQKEGWHVVYLATSAAEPTLYRKLRDWMMEKMGSDADPLPSGPVLAREKLLKGEPEVSARKNVLATIKNEFAGPVLYLAAEGGLKLFSVGKDGGFAGDPLPVLDWDKLVKTLPKS
jgi:hypothetical protein